MSDFHFGRRWLGEGESVDEPHEVSTRVTAHAIAAAEASGRAAALAGVGVDEARLRSETDWIDWAAYQRLIVALAGGEDAETLRLHGRREIEHAARTPYASLPSLFGGTPGLFHATYRWVLPFNVRVVESAMVVADAGLRLELRLARHCDDGRAFFGAVVGTLEHLPTLAGDLPALVRASIGTHEAAYDVQLMPSSGFAGRLRRAWWTLWDGNAAESARRTHESITGAIERFEAANATLMAAEARWRGLAAEHLGAALVVDPAGLILERLAGRDLGRGRFLDEGLRDDQRAHVHGQLARVFAGRSVAFEVETEDGRWFSCRAGPVAGAGPRALLVAHDVTDARVAAAALRANEARFAEARKLEAIGRVAAELTHERTHLLAAARSEAELLAARHADPDVQRAVATIVGAIDGATELTGWLHAERGGESVVDAREALRRALWPGLGADVALRADLDGPPALVGLDPEALRRLVRELLTNAREALPGGGTVRVAIDEVALDEPRPDLAPATYVRILVADDGVGMSEAVRKRALEPFFSGWGGRGLGLASVYFTAVGAGGTVDVVSRPGGGTAVQVWLRRTEPRRLAVPGAVRGTETVLLAEDQPQVREALAQLLTAYGYRVHAAAHGEQALSIAARLGDGFDVLVTDLDMPVLGGIDLVRRLRATRPALPIVLVSGDPSADGELRDDPAVTCLHKPFGGRALAGAIRLLVDGRS